MYLALLPQDAPPLMSWTEAIPELHDVVSGTDQMIMSNSCTIQWFFSAPPR